MTRHILVVHEDPDDDMEVEHPDDCPTEPIYDGSGWIYTCDVGHIEWQEGLDQYFRPTELAAPGDYYSEYIAPGRHEIEYWQEVKRGGACFPDEIESGLRLVSEARP